MTREIKWPVIGMRNKKASFILYARGNIVFFTLWLCLWRTVWQVSAGGFLFFTGRNEIFLGGEAEAESQLPSSH